MLANNSCCGHTHVYTCNAPSDWLSASCQPLVLRAGLFDTPGATVLGHKTPLAGRGSAHWLHFGKCPMPPPFGNISAVSRGFQGLCGCSSEGRMPPQGAAFPSSGKLRGPHPNSGTRCVGSIHPGAPWEGLSVISGCHLGSCIRVQDALKCCQSMRYCCITLIPGPHWC